MHNPFAMRPDEYTDALSTLSERGEIVAYLDDDGELRLVSSQHASGYHYDHAVSAERLRAEAERSRSAWRN